MGIKNPMPAASNPDAKVNKAIKKNDYLGLILNKIIIEFNIFIILI